MGWVRQRGNAAHAEMSFTSADSMLSDALCKLKNGNVFYTNQSSFPNIKTQKHVIQYPSMTQQNFYNHKHRFFGNQKAL